MMKRHAHFCIKLGLAMTVFASISAGPATSSQGTVVGIVLDERNRPAVDLVLYLVRDEPSSAPRTPIKSDQNASVNFAEQVIDKATTDEKGKFTFSNVPAGAYLLRGGSKQRGFVYVDVAVKPSQTVNLGQVRLTKI